MVQGSAIGSPAQARSSATPLQLQLDRDRDCPPSLLTFLLAPTDPLVDNLPLQTSKPLDDSPEAIRTAAALNEVSRMIIEVRSA